MNKSHVLSRRLPGSLGSVENDEKGVVKDQNLKKAFERFRLSFMISFPRSGCFKSFGQYSGDELEKEPRTSEENANACQARCAATKGCSFFSFKEVRGWCGMSSRAAELT